jgi:hypothetical protein
MTAARIYVIAGLISLAISAATAFAVIKFLEKPSSPDPARVTDSPAPPKTTVEEGEIEVTLGSDRKGVAQHFYRIPFASPPQLTYPGEYGPGYWNCQITSQTAEGFKVERDVSTQGSYSTTCNFKWRAEGLPKRFP